MPKRLVLARLALSSLAWLALPCLATPPDPAVLVASLKRDVPAKTPYTEVRFSGLFDRPLILHGELEYSGPGKLGKTVDKPYKEIMKIADGKGEVTRGSGEPRRFSLGQAPELEGFLHGFTALLGGDSAALQKDFELEATGSEANWRLVLTPRDSRLLRRVSAIEVDGGDGKARCFRTREAGGDTNVLLVESLADVDLPTRPSPMQIDGLCRGIAIP